MRKPITAKRFEFSQIPYKYDMKKMAAAHTAPTPSHTSTAAVASFRTWRDSQFRVARGPVKATIERARMISTTKSFGHHDYLK
jgi:hypothetical protein